MTPRRAVNSILSLEFKRHQARLRLTQLQTMILDFRHQCANLDQEIEATEKEPRNSDPTHFAYSMYATDLRSRKMRLEHSIEALEFELRAISVGLENRPIAA